MCIFVSGFHRLQGKLAAFLPGTASVRMEKGRKHRPSGTSGPSAGMAEQVGMLFYDNPFFDDDVVILECRCLVGNLSVLDVHNVTDYL